MPSNEELYRLVKGLLSVASNQQQIIERLMSAVSAHQAFLTGQQDDCEHVAIDRSAIERATAEVAELEKLWRQTGGSEAE